MATLEELKKKKKESGLVENPDGLKKLSINDIKKILPEKEEEGTPKQILQQELDDLDAVLFADMEKIEEKYDQEYNEKEQEIQDAIFDAPVEDIDNGLMKEEDAQIALKAAFDNAVTELKEDPSIKAGIEAVSNVGKNTTTPENMDMEDFLKELDDEDEEEDDDIVDISEDSDDDDDEVDEEEQKQMLKDLQNQVSTVIKPFENVIDLKSFTISTKPKSASKILEEANQVPTANWVLLESKAPFSCTALGAVEIENLNPEKTSVENGRLDGLKQMYGTLFRHYASPNKPATLEEWVKTISYTDQDNLLFGYYKATFGQSNFFSYICEDCKETKIEKMPIESCIKYRDDETKQEVEKILKYGDPTHKNEIQAKLVQVSDKLAVSIKNPSIYNIVFEFGVLDAEFTRKFADVLGTVGYIENIYEIDLASRQLVPISIKEDPKNITKSVKRRIRAKVEVLKTLTPDQYNILISEIANITRNAERITYCQPAWTCPKCGKEITEAEMSAQQLLFMRHQLVLIKTLSIE